MGFARGVNKHSEKDTVSSMTSTEVKKKNFFDVQCLGKELCGYL